jgi:4-diphosphocytidyl-2-C-methyl-D-erythritol kinase
LSHGTAICRGRGERVERLPPLPSYYFVVVKPPEALRTQDVFCAHDSIANSGSRPVMGQVNRLIANLYLRSWRDINKQMHNQLQAAAASLSPILEKLRGSFSQLDFVAHQLSGSGTAYFGLCRHAQHARRLSNVLRTQQLGAVFVTRNCH